ncbi:hypothetical protein FB451DRAFT_1172762 [Mycena latifolia]|nr:hypothetical protein FB451DRAFT_1172762 [Mycena latifolia]
MNADAKTAEEELGSALVDSRVGRKSKEWVQGCSRKSSNGPRNVVEAQNENSVGIRSDAVQAWSTGVARKGSAKNKNRDSGDGDERSIPPFHTVIDKTAEPYQWRSFST